MFLVLVVVALITAMIDGLSDEASKSISGEERRSLSAE